MDSERIARLAARVMETKEALVRPLELNYPEGNEAVPAPVDPRAADRALFALGVLTGGCVKKQLEFPNLSVGSDLDGRVTMTYEGGEAPTAWYVVHRLAPEGPVSRVWKIREHGPAKRELEFWDAMSELERLLIAAQAGALGEMATRRWVEFRDGAHQASG